MSNYVDSGYADCGIFSLVNKKHYTHAEVLQLLEKRQGERTQKELAEELGVSQQYLCDLYQGKRYVGVKILEALGMYREWSYYFER
jgi:transcriptional regulator with XRE-family HTH domain